MFSSLIKKVLFFGVLLLFICTVSNAQTDRIWDGSVDTLWGTVLNWTSDIFPDGNAVPDNNTENAIVNNVLSGNYPHIENSNYTVYDVRLNASDGSITINNGRRLTVSNTLRIDNGDFIINANVYARGDVTIYGGTFVNTGIIYFDGSTNLTSNNQNFGNIIVNDGHSLTLHSNLTCNNLTVYGTLDTNGHNLTVANDLLISNGIFQCSAPGGTIDVGTLTFSGGSMIMDNPDSLIISTGDFIVNSISSNYNGAVPVAITTGDLIVSNGTVSFGDAVHLNGADGDVNISGGSVTFDSTISINGVTGDCLISGSGSITNTGLLMISRDFSMTGGTQNGIGNIIVGRHISLSNPATDFSGDGRDITVSGNWTSEANTFTANGSTVIFNNNTALLSTGTTFFNVEISGSVSLVTELNVGNDLTLSSGTLDVANNMNSIYVGRHWYRDELEAIFTAHNGTVYFTGDGAIQNAEDFDNVTVSSGERTCNTGFSVNNELTVDGGRLTCSINGTVHTGSLTLSGGNMRMNSPVLLQVVTGNLTVNDTASVFIGNDETLITTGDLDVSNGTAVFNDTLRLTGEDSDIYVSGGTAVFNDTATVEGTTGDCEISGGSTENNALLSINHNIRIDAGSLETTNNLTVMGNFTITNGTFSNTGLVVFNGITQLQSNTRNFGNIEVTDGNEITLLDQLTCNNITINGTFRAAGHQMNITGNWSRTGVFVHNNNLVEFRGINTLGNSETFYDLTITSDHSLDITGYTLTVGHLFNIENNGTLYRAGTGETAPSDPDSGTVAYRGAGGTIQIYAGTDYRNLDIQGPGTFVLHDDIDIGRDLLISGGALTANTHTITLAGTFNSNPGGTFNYNTSTVIFVDALIDSEVRGTNTFYNFICTAQGKTIYFEQNVRQTIALGGSFIINGSDEISRINLYSTYTLSFPHPAGNYSNNQEPEQWIIHISPSATASVNWVRVQLSYSDYVIIPDNAVFHDPDWCYNWLFGVPVYSSWTMDTNNNGKIDRIGVLVEPMANLNDDFSNLTILVHGYELQSQDDPCTTYADINHPDPNEEYDDTFYIILSEGPDLDTDFKPGWYIPAGGNISLKVLTGIDKYVYTQGGEYSQKPYDLAAPVIAYTLAVADKNEVFVCFSEPVVRTNGNPPWAGNFEFDGSQAREIVRITTKNDGVEEVLVRFDSNITALQVYNEDPLTVTPSLRDMASPSDGNELASHEHRISDIGLGLHGNGIIEPVWARDETGTDPVLGGAGHITVFDGTEWLRDQNLTIQAHIHDDIPPDLGTKLFMDVDVESQYVVNGFWLPGFNTRHYNGIVPGANPSARSTSGVVISNPFMVNGLQNYTLSPDDPEIRDGALIEFVFKITGNKLYCARLTDDHADNWYRNVRPWSFYIHDILHQDAGVTIMGNIINPDLGEKVKLHYILKKTGKVTIYVFDLKGDIVDILCHERKRRGDYSIAWDGRNRGGRVVARGVYFIKIVAPDINEIRKVLVVK